jgi:molybdopterin molybdotransferase
MAQLSNIFSGSSSPLMSIEEAVALATSGLKVAARIEMVSLRGSDGRIAAEDVYAYNNLPPFPNSAVDGYAVCHADLNSSGETLLPIEGRLAAGSSEVCSASGHAVRIFTGAAMPPDADTVFMQEDVRVEGASVVLPEGLRAGANVRLAGEDITRGERIIAAGRRLIPPDIALAAATGHRRLPVRRPLRVGVFSTGNELVKPGVRLKPGTIYDSNRAMLLALLDRFGAKVRDMGILPDDPRSLTEHLAEAAIRDDVILSSGGVSVGEEDHVKAAVEANGHLVFWKLAIRPGRPLAMGVVGRAPFIGLPGNPAAAYVTFIMFVRPVLAHLGGAALQPVTSLRVRSTFSQKKRAGRREYVRVNVSSGSDGVLEARRFPKEGAALLTSLTTTDGIAEIPEETTAVAAGDFITFYPHDAFW